MAKSKWRGNEIIFDELADIWVYKSDGMWVQYDPNRKCGNCSKENSENGHDNCISNLKGVMNACCGHGISDEAFVQFLDGFSINGEEAVVIQNILKKYRDK